jgi:hypothetical protein
VRFTDPDERPYFLWSEATTVGQFREALARADDAERAQLLGRLMREARDPDVWEFTTVAEVRRLFPLISRYLGRRRAFWTWLIDSWVELGLA